MRSLNVNITLYLFDELSEQVQNHLVDLELIYMQDIDYQCIMQPVFDICDEHLSILFDNHEIAYSDPSSGQGSGFTFTGEFKEETVKTVLYDDSFRNLDFTGFEIVRSGLSNFYTHEYTSQVNYADESEDPDNTLYAALEVLEQYRLSLCRKYKAMFDQYVTNNLNRSHAVDRLRSQAREYYSSGRIFDETDIASLTTNISAGE